MAAAETTRYRRGVALEEGVRECGGLSEGWTVFKERKTRERRECGGVLFDVKKVNCHNGHKRSCRLGRRQQQASGLRWNEFFHRSQTSKGTVPGAVGHAFQWEGQAKTTTERTLWKSPIWLCSSRVLHGARKCASQAREFVCVFPRPFLITVGGRELVFEKSAWLFVLCQALCLCRAFVCEVISCARPRGQARQFSRSIHFLAMKQPACAWPQAGKVR